MKVFVINLKKFVYLEASLDTFFIIFKLICLQFQFKNLPIEFELIRWFKHLVSLPCTYENYEEPKYMTFLGTFTTVEESIAKNNNVDPLQMKNAEVANKPLEQELNVAEIRNVDLESVVALNKNKIIVPNYDHLVKEENQQATKSTCNKQQSKNINNMQYRNKLFRLITLLGFG